MVDWSRTRGAEKFHRVMEPLVTAISVEERLQMVQTMKTMQTAGSGEETAKTSASVTERRARFSQRE